MKDTVHDDTNNSMNKLSLYRNEESEKKILKKENNQKIQDQSSSQQNAQDLDQHQNVDINPSQLNFQNVQIVTDSYNNYTGKILGYTYLEKTKKFVSNAKILLYFGSDGGFPVCKTKSDDTGSFVIKDLPPGYYTLHVYLDNVLYAKVPNIKVLPGKNIHQSITLKNFCDSSIRINEL
ncbi:MAG: carboxypeptidase-like regulatory domain-containing protein [Tepidibacter sp.]|jgi:hypothetical protein|uniref:carboxypeptidase-like regulatory domain-containing protein n=1 Tax=Tepidibacter sp. TaxID=2529387 RepID=UPI0025D59576|nr:carboxypeptidase-like regulatory domain-containing protein [Tepidibacter sp.]MCT4507411.1 carboxypeptidase-like regulatory domain-containing protein [Tepidibacter sp.]